MTMPAFYENPTIKRLAASPKWTISADDNKTPLDMFEFSVKHHLCGAVYGQEGATTTLCEIDGLFDDGMVPSKHVFHLDVLEDDIVVLDIEPTCPQGIKDEFLRFPYIYGEVSMSGKGLHLVFPKPKNFAEFEAASKKLAIKGENKHYEILLQHWVTFTGNVIEPTIAPGACDQSAFEAFYATIAKTQTSTCAGTPFDMGDLDLTDIPHVDGILEVLIHANPFKGTVESYDNDMSRWEMAWVRHKYRRMLTAMHVNDLNPDGHVYTLQERAAILNEVCKQALPHRSKHDTWHTSQFNTWYEQLVYHVISSNTNVNDPARIDDMASSAKRGENDA